MAFAVNLFRSCLTSRIEKWMTFSSLQRNCVGLVTDRTWQKFNFWLPLVTHAIPLCRSSDLQSIIDSSIRLLQTWKSYRSASSSVLCSRGPTQSRCQTSRLPSCPRRYLRSCRRAFWCSRSYQSCPSPQRTWAALRQWKKRDHPDGSAW